MNETPCLPNAMTREDAERIAQIVEEKGLTCFGAIAEIAVDGGWCVVWVQRGTGEVKRIRSVSQLETLISAEEVPIEQEG